MDSILNSVKKVLSIPEEYKAFDQDVMLHINSTFATLHQLGVGPEAGFAILDETSTWDDFMGVDPTLNSVKSYVYLKVRMLFDPPQTSYLIEAMNKQAEAFEWRINVRREEVSWVNPMPLPTTE